MKILIEYIGVGTAPPNVAIWDKFSEQHQHQNNKKTPYSMPNGPICTFLGENKVQIQCTFWMGINFAVWNKDKIERVINYNEKTLSFIIYFIKLLISVCVLGRKII